MRTTDTDIQSIEQFESSTYLITVTGRTLVNLYNKRLGQSTAISFNELEKYARQGSTDAREVLELINKPVINVKDKINQSIKRGVTMSKRRTKKLNFHYLKK